MIVQLAHLVIGVVDLLAAFLFMYGLKRMSSPVTAPSGIFVAGIGMLAAIAASFLYAVDVDAAARPFLASTSRWLPWPFSSAVGSPGGAARKLP